MNLPASSHGRLGDTAARDYSRKLQLFNAFARPELRQAIATLALKPGMRVLDAGCGTGEALGWLAAEVGREGTVVGMDLATAHIAAARAVRPENAWVIQADLLTTPLAPASFDAIWSVNTFNHLHDPLAAVKAATRLLRPGGRIALGQSSLLPDMYFAWDSRLERLTNEAVRQYYRHRYQLSERGLTAVRSLVGLLRAAGLHNVTARTFMIERVSPVSAQDEHYLVEAIFQSTWGARLRPYLLKEDYEQLTRLCDPEHPDFALRRPDFHFLQSFTLVVGAVEPE
ncbi:class I SAM-dependent methyltransferase [Pseudoxanthomonas sp. UTMC 1351]|uniref:class I SAM-dependent methyltransferase n=1 Tax=Pseudoxanthomonas sp. UTMC 1351 TaxID=2695853 RepID=UPI0034CDC758